VPESEVPDFIRLNAMGGNARLTMAARLCHLCAVFSLPDKRQKKAG